MTTEQAIIKGYTHRVYNASTGGTRYFKSAKAAYAYADKADAAYGAVRYSVHPIS